MSRQFTALFQPNGWDHKSFNAEQYFVENLRTIGIGPLLLVFDNFETVQQPIDVFNWLDTHVRSPNKILITTRERDFKGDYPVDVGGMTEHQCNELVLRTGEAIGLTRSITPEFSRDVYKESEGHPYVVKILVGESADGKKVRRIERIVAGKDDLLDALFERTYKRLSPAAKRVFLTLSNWRSLVAHCALDAALLRPHQSERIDTVAATDELRRVSFVDEHISPHDNIMWLGVPLVAAVFGKRKLSTYPEQSVVETDTQYLQRFGATQPSDVKAGFQSRVQRFFASLSEDLAHSRLKLADEMPVLELIARYHPPTWLMIADLWRESPDASAGIRVIESLTRYVEATPPTLHQKLAWERMANIHRQQRNWADFVNAQVQIAELPGADLATISASVNTFNSVSHNLDTEARRTFARRFARAMEHKIVDGDATDCSRLAWVFIRCDQEERALQIVDCGLRVDATNEYCQSLKLRVWRQRAETARLTNDRLAMIDAFIHIAEVPTSEFQELSDAVNLFNQMGRDLEPDQDRRNLLGLRLAKVCESRIHEANATDRSRVAWVMMQIGEHDQARKIVDVGLQMEPHNDHCLKLRARLN